MEGERGEDEEEKEAYKLIRPYTEPSTGKLWKYSFHGKDKANGTIQYFKDEFNILWKQMQLFTAQSTNSI